MVTVKKLLAVILAVSALGMSAAAAGESAPEITTPHAVLMEKETGCVVYEKNADERVPPASVTKVMTILLIVEALERGDITLDDTVTASANAESMGGSQIYLEAGESMSVRDMLKSIVVASSNDAAEAMAEYLCGTEADFVSRMNSRAAELGLENTHFTNCTGLFDDEEHYTSARDIAVMSRELMLHGWIRDYTTIWMDSIRDGEFGLSNTNKLVRHYEGCTGLKTGFTSEAMYCLSATAERGGMELIAVIMHAESIESRNRDASTLLNYGFAGYELCALRPDGALPPVRVALGESDSVQPVCEGESALLLEKGTVSGVERTVALAGSVPAPVRAGDRLGTLTVTAGGETLAEVPIVAGGDVGRLSSWALLWQMLGLLAGVQSA